MQHCDPFEEHIQMVQLSGGRSRQASASWQTEQKEENYAKRQI